MITSGIPQGGIIRPGLGSAFSKNGYFFLNQFSYIYNFLHFFPNSDVWTSLSFKMSYSMLRFDENCRFFGVAKKTSVNKHTVYQKSIFRNWTQKMCTF